MDVKPSFKKKYVVITASILSVLFIAAFLYFVFPVLLLGGVFDNPPPSKNKLINLVSNHKDDFENTINYIRSLDSSIIGVKLIKGKVCSYTAGTTEVTPVDNESLKKVFKNGVQNIYIGKSGVEFFCGGAGREYYTGLFYSYSGEPVNLIDVDLNGASPMKLTSKGDGRWEWNEENGDNRFYCEKVEGNWFYYQMWY